MIRWALVFGALVSLPIWGALACYATTGPVATCPQDPTQPGCFPPIHDMRADGGR